jgi:hypothetical protein
MSSIYRVHAASVGKAATKASRGTMDAALREAKFQLSSGHDFVWVDDGNGNVLVPAAEVRARLDQSARATQRSDPQGAPPLDGLEPRMSAGLEPRIMH